ncbi:MAG: TolC family protein [Cyclobacteriaceae bacterium]
MNNIAFPKSPCFKVLIIALAFCSFRANGQEALSLSGALAQGLNNNFDIRIEQGNVAVAENNNKWGEAGRYPTVSFGLNQNNSLTDNVKTASPFQLQDITLANSLNPSINLNWTLFNGFKINMSKRRLDQLQAESEGNASIVIANNIQAIILGYYLASLELERLDAFKKQLILSMDKFEYVKTGKELGTSGTSELLLEEGNYLTDSVNLINQQLAYRNAVRNLNILMGVEQVDKDYHLTDQLPTEFPNFIVENLQEKMLNNNVDLKKQFITQALLGTSVKITKADRYPSLSLNAGISENRSRVDLSKASFPQGDGSFAPGPTDPLNAVTDNYFANFTLSFALFNGGKINRAIRNSLVQEDIGNIRMEKLRASLTNSLLSAHDRYQIRQQIYEINLKREQSAKMNLDISADKFKNGSINSFDYRVVQNTYLSASVLKLQSIYDLMDSKVELMRLTGGLIEEYSSADQ